jgi:hypothetical protein
MPETYWERSDLFDMALDLTAGRRGLEALGKVIKQWITHLLSIEVEIEALTEAADVNLIWYVGLDAEATTIGMRSGTTRNSSSPRVSASLASTGSPSATRKSCWTRRAANPSI